MMVAGFSSSWTQLIDRGRWVAPGTNHSFVPSHEVDLAGLAGLIAVPATATFLHLDLDLAERAARKVCGGESNGEPPGASLARGLCRPGRLCWAGAGTCFHRWARKRFGASLMAAGINNAELEKAAIPCRKKKKKEKRGRLGRGPCLIWERE